MAKTHPWRSFKLQTLPPRPLNYKCIERELTRAHAAVARYRALLLRIPDPQEELSPLLLREAAASLEAQKIDPNDEETAHQHYLAALKYCIREAETKSLTKKMLCTAHNVIKTGKKRGPLTYRTRQNWIGPEGCTKEEAYFFPPKPRDVSQLMRALFHYCKEPDRDPLVQTAIAFAQFLIIHPFMDGNGRVARILIPILLYKKHLLPSPMLFMSRYFKDHRLSYFRELFNITENKRWERWILFFLKGVAREANQAAACAQKKPRKEKLFEAGDNTSI